MEGKEVEILLIVSGAAALTREIFRVLEIIDRPETGRKEIRHD